MATVEVPWSAFFGIMVGSPGTSIYEQTIITDGNVLEMLRMLAKGKALAGSARMTKVTETIARKYRDDARLSSQRKLPRQHRTQRDPFAEVWQQVQARLEAEPQPVA
ncbi:MAG: hypothetical protein R3C05_30805 [Pirellulaceae bacterium]